MIVRVISWYYPDSDQFCDEELVNTPLKDLRRIVHAENDPLLYDVYKLDELAVKQIDSELLVDFSRFEYFLEAYELKK